MAFFLCLSAAEVLPICLYSQLTPWGQVFYLMQSQGLKLIADILANVAGFCILILIMFNSAPFGRANSLWNEVPLHINTHSCMFMKYFF